MAPVAAAEGWRETLRDIPLGPLHLDIGGQVRLRYELDDGFTVKGYASDTRDHLLLERIMVSAGLRWRQRLRVFLELRDAHAVYTRLVDGVDFPRNNPLEDHGDLRQAYLEGCFASDHPVGFRIGRQQISHGDQRVFGPGQWGNTGRWIWDAAMVKVRTRYLWADTWIGRSIVNRPDVWPNRWSDGPLVVGLDGGVRRLPLRLEPFYLMKYQGWGPVAGERGTGDLLSHSLGIQLEGSLVHEWLTYGGTYVLQVGRHGGDRLLAHGANVQVGLRLPLPWRPWLRAQLTWGSGDRSPDDGRHGTFDGVAGGADIYFYGQMNLLYWANLRDYELDLRLQPVRWLEARVEYHGFTLDQARDAWYTTGLSPLRRDLTGRSGLGSL